MNNIKADTIILGKNVIIEPSAIIKGINGNAKHIAIGDNKYIGHDVQIICEEFSIGDYGKIHNHTTIHGYKPCIIGHNAWIGQFSIIDSIGGVLIGNNCGIGAHSQLWSHIKYGDTLEGCQFNSSSLLEIGDDVWFVGHCIVSPIKAESKSMALAGSVITKNMNFNEIYAGSPAESITHKIGNQFKSVDLEQKAIQMNIYLNIWQGDKTNIKLIKDSSEIDFNATDITYFNIADRKYTKRLTTHEVEFMNYLLPEKAKFIPY